jgi:hypothetical protein
VIRGFQRTDVIGHLPKEHDWYDLIEPGVREIVRLLRNNGFNTIMSCEHTMTVCLELPVSECGKETARLRDLLRKNGFGDSTIRVLAPTDPEHRPILVAFPLIDDVGPSILDDGTIVANTLRAQAAK